MTEPAGFEDVSYALRFREYVRTIVQDLIDGMRPLPRFGHVKSLNRFDGTAQVVFQGDTEPTACRMMPSVEPSQSDEVNAAADPTAGDTVRIEGRPGSYWITGVVTSREFQNQPNMYHPQIWGGDFADQPMLRFDSRSAQLPATVGNTYHVGRWDNTLSFASDGTGFLEIEIQWTFFTNQIKKYALAITQSVTLSGWQKVAPIFDSGPFNDNDFQLELLVDGTGYELRIRRTVQGAGFSPGGFSIRQWQYFDNIAFVEGSSQGEAVTTEPNRFWATSDIQHNKGMLLSPMYAAPRIAQFGLVGGGQINWDGATLGWGRMFRTASLGQGYNVKTGYYEIGQPAVGIVIPVYGNTGVSSVTTIAAGIPLANSQCLYYEPPWGDVFSTVDANFRIVDPTNSEFAVPAHWILVAQRCPLTNTFSLKLGTGELLDHWRTVSLAANWINFGGSFDPFGFKWVDGRGVHVRGMVVFSGAANPAGNPVFATLGTDYRPTLERIFLCKTQGAGTSARVDIRADGGLQVVTADSNGTYFDNGTTHGHLSLNFTYYLS